MKLLFFVLALILTVTLTTYRPFTFTPTAQLTYTNTVNW